MTARRLPSGDLEPTSGVAGELAARSSFAASRMVCSSPTTLHSPALSALATVASVLARSSSGIECSGFVLDFRPIDSDPSPTPPPESRCPAPGGSDPERSPVLSERRLHQECGPPCVAPDRRPTPSGDTGRRSEAVVRRDPSPNPPSESSAAHGRAGRLDFTGRIRDACWSGRGRGPPRGARQAPDRRAEKRECPSIMGRSARCRLRGRRLSLTHASEPGRMIAELLDAGSSEGQMGSVG